MNVDPSTDQGTDDGAGGGRMTRIYVGVVALEVVVLLGLWMFQRYFGG
jgi:hypothetical protein